MGKIVRKDVKLMKSQSNMVKNSQKQSKTFKNIQKHSKIVKNSGKSLHTIGLPCETTFKVTPTADR